MRIFFIILSIILLSPILVKATNRDTILNAVISKPYFYNVIKGKDEKIFAGTSDGIFEISGSDLLQYNNQVGYLTADKTGNPIIDLYGISHYSDRQYLHLLPYPDFGREEYHTSSERNFYICSGGRLYIYDLTDYSLSYPLHSIRSISENLVSSY